MGLLDSLYALVSSLTGEEEEDHNHRNQNQNRYQEPSDAASTSTTAQQEVYQSAASSSSTAIGHHPSMASLNKKRIAEKLKGYFDLAKKEIDKAVRAEEWGLSAESIPHYTNARAILSEAISLYSSFDSSSDSEEITLYQRKILKWQAAVCERLRELQHRKVLSMNKNADSTLKSRLPISGNSQFQRNANVSKPNRLNATNSFRTNVSVNHSSSAGCSQIHKTDVKGVDPQLLQMIENTIVDRSPSVRWDDIAGLSKAKQALMEMVILPTKRRDLFTGLRKPARGLLLFGPPGNGKTMLAKAVASESEATFFSVAASSLTSKWVGEAEKLMKALFSVAAARQPSVIFIDEIDSIMSARSANENEASRRLKSEFLIQFDGVLSNQNDHVILMGATNLPMELDDAVLRRLVKRIYIPLPDAEVRRALLKNKLKGHQFSLPGSDLEALVNETDGYSGSDLQALCEEAAMMPIRELGSRINSVRASQVRPLCFSDFKEAMKVIRPSVSKKKLIELEQWNEQYGSR